MLSKLDVITFKGDGVSVFRVDLLFYALQVACPEIREVNFPAGMGISLVHL